MYSYEKIAQILRTDKDVVRILEEKLSATTGKKGILDKIIEENEAILRSRLDTIGGTPVGNLVKIHSQDLIF